MDHVLNDLRNWLDIWEEDLKREREMEVHEHQESNIKILKADIEAIKQAMKLISSRC